MSGLTILTFGGFEVWRGSRRLADFESWKVRTLAAYLVGHHGRSVPRDRVAALLWPDRGADAARRNLRQALYNLRSTVEGVGDDRTFVSDARSVRFAPSRECWLDLEAFETALDGHAGDGEPSKLAEAVRLYRGEFLAGVQAGESLELEEWLVQEQERLRDAAVAALRELVDHYLATGAYSLGIHHARRLLRIDPLSEETHRKLMRLYALSGRRSRAVAQFQELRKLLDRELGVAPLAESEALYHEIREARVAAPAPPARSGFVGPALPLVGRERELTRLRHDWEAVLQGRGRVSWIEGEEGAGTTRLARSTLSALGVGDRATVLLGRHFDLAPRTAYAGLREAVEGVVRHEAEAAERLAAEAFGEDLRTLSSLAPPIADLIPSLDRPAPTPPDPLELAAVLGRTLPLAARPRRPGAGPTACVLFLEDLHRADPESLAVLDALGDLVRDQPVWVFLTASLPTPDRVARGRSARPGEGTGETIELHRLGEEATAKIAGALVQGHQVGELTGLLLHQSGGLPLAAAETVNLLWDRRLLQPREGGWALTGARPAASSEGPGPALPDLVEARFGELPPSTRRLVALASVVGPRFDVATLCAVEGEDPRVVEANLQLLVERWWLRLHLGYWADSRQDRDLALWTARSPNATFEFSHEAVRRSVYGILGADRRRSLHRKVLRAFSRSTEGCAEATLLYHAARAREPAQG